MKWNEWKENIFKIFIASFKSFPSIFIVKLKKKEEKRFVLYSLIYLDITIIIIEGYDFIENYEAQENSGNFYWKSQFLQPSNMCHKNNFLSFLLSNDLSIFEPIILFTFYLNGSRLTYYYFIRLKVL